MKQIVPKPIRGLVILARKNALAAARHRGDINLLHNTEEKIIADVVSVETAVFDYNQACTGLRGSYALLGEKTEVAKTCVTITREILKLKLGKQYSDRWAATGFVRSIAIPRSADALIPLLLYLSRYLGDNPGLQVSALNVTAADLATLHLELLAALNAVNRNRAAVDQLLVLRNEKVAKLRKRVRDLVAELQQVIDPTDGRWLGFGLNMPGLEEKPEVPKEIEAVVVDQSTVMLSFARPPRAAYYRVYQRIIGVDAEPVYVGSPADPDFTSEDLPKDSTVEFYICAVNSGGESALSPPVVVKME